MRALCWVAHPVTVAATAVLYLNDHVFKQAWPGPVTGKLSDVAGMVMFPALLGAMAGLVGVPLRVSRWAAPVVTAAGFAWVKATVAGAAAASAAWGGVVLRDPSDLVALPAVVLAWWAAGRVRPVPDAWARRARLFAALGFALVATAATSAPAIPDAALHVRETPEGIAVSGPFGTVVSPDLTRWTVAGRAEPAGFTTEWARVEDALKAARPEGCDPADARHCYRVSDRLPEWDGRQGEIPRGGALLGVEETLDGGATWAMAWEVPPARWEFLAARHELYTRRDAPLMVSTDLLVRAVPGGHQVIVANGVEGLAVREADGTWRRVAVDVPKGPSIRPLALRAFAAATGVPGNNGMAIALLTAIVGGVVIAARAGSRRGGAGVIAWPLLIVPVLVFGTGYGAWVEGRASLLLALVLPIGGFFAAWFQRVLPRGRALAVLGSPVLVAAAYTAPFFGWSLGAPAARDDANRIGLIAAGVAACASLAVSWWAAGKPLPRRARVTSRRLRPW
ncbi:hypothetical protein Afil01_08630 [Actinorhabdospora filicis]|uniref:Uncharacterized protein n=1 Tax=Actinorhabdospora filicis TaxID=1785913 RepID=A0A9W6W827_9ACTN|nr:hypothetical protein [Actinorhabdospora filicis]GLZ76056.1 hypothetical protein Afil01_08630 [Actinorhabdospora filicis]